MQTVESGPPPLPFARMRRDRPGGTVTFLCTGIDDSTRPSEEAARDTAAALRSHAAIVE